MGTEIFFILPLPPVLILLLPRCCGRQTKIWKCVRGKEACSSINLCFLLLSRVARLLVKWGTLSNDALSVAQSLVVLGIWQRHANALGGATRFFSKINLNSSYFIFVKYSRETCRKCVKYKLQYSNSCSAHLSLFCTMTNKCTIISQIITLLHVSTLSCHPQTAYNQYLAKLHKYFKYSCW